MAYLTSHQQQVVDCVRQKHNVVLTGPGGTGKTEIIKYIKNIEQELIKPGNLLGITALTGTASLLVPTATTLHSYLGIGLGKSPINTIIKNLELSNKISVWRRLQLLVIDEMSMISNELFDKLNTIAKKTRNNQQPFGGIQIVLAGDFLQLPCIDGHFCFKAMSWESCNFKIFHLTQIIRQTDKMFQEILNRARFGKITSEDVDYLEQNSLKRVNNEIEPTRILCKNVDVDTINMEELEALPSQEIYKYTQKTSLICPPGAAIGDDTHNVRLETPAPKELFLSVGAQVMLCVNLDLPSGLANGSRGVVVAFKKMKSATSPSTLNLPVVKFFNSIITVNYHEFEITNNEGSKVAVITQIPLKLAYAITVHKSMGMTIDSACINLKGVFEYGQAYVALSRVKDLANLSLKNIDEKSFKAHPEAIEFYQQTNV